MNLTCLSAVLRHDDKVDVLFGTLDEDGRAAILTSIEGARQYDIGSVYAFDDSDLRVGPNPLDVD